MTIFGWLIRLIRRQLAQPAPFPQTPERSRQSKTSGGLSGELPERIDWFRKQLSGSSDIACHTFTAEPGVNCAIMYIKGMIDRKSLEQNVLDVIVKMKASSAGDLTKQLFEHRRLPIAEQCLYDVKPDAMRAMLDGEVLLLVEGDRRILSLTLAKFEKRAIEEAQNESLIRGPRESFIEDLETNVTLVRKRLRTNAFKMETMQIGTDTSTTVGVVYLDGKCQPHLVDEVKRRLAQIEIDGVLESGYLEELIEDNPYSPFPQIQYTERPDVVSGALLEGRVAILVDGTPIVLLAPVSIFMLLQTAEDYYQRYVASTWIRWIRYLYLFISLLAPSFYVAITTFHPDIIPERLLVTIASSREIVPFPAMLEAIMMELSFEALREASLRIPKAVGQAVSIIGALIIGTAAVEAGIVSAAMVIIVSLTGVASFIIPHYDLGLAFRVLRFPIMILAGMLGIFGIACGLILIYFHLIELRSFGLPYLEPMAPLRSKDLKDVVVRAPWWKLKTHPSFAASDNRRLHMRNRRPAPLEDEE